MIIGSGLLAQLFSPYANNDQIIIFASGVSNSQETKAEAFKREHDLLFETIEKNPEKILVYFSTCSIYDPSAKDSMYVKHKKNMEDMIVQSMNNYYIFRLSHVVGKTNSPTIVNYLLQKIKKGEHFELWARSRRNLIDGQDVFKIINYVLNHGLFKNEIINVASVENLSIEKIVNIMEKLLDKSADFTLIQKGASYDIDIGLIAEILPKVDVCFENNYVISILKKML